MSYFVLPGEMREQLERVTAERDALRVQLETLRSEGGPHPAELLVSCTCKVAGTAGAEDAPEPAETAIDPACPAHGWAADLMVYGRRFEAMERALRATLGDELDPWDDPVAVVLEAVRKLKSVDAALERAELPRNLGGIEQALAERRAAVDSMASLSEEVRSLRAKSSDLRAERNKATREAHDAGKLVDTLAGDLEGTTAQLNETRALYRAARTELASLKSREARSTPTEEAIPDAPDAGEGEHSHP